MIARPYRLFAAKGTGLTPAYTLHAKTGGIKRWRLGKSSPIRWRWAKASPSWPPDGPRVRRRGASQGAPGKTVRAGDGTHHLFAIAQPMLRLAQSPLAPAIH
jgi:hypothetical protein